MLELGIQIPEGTEVHAVILIGIEVRRIRSNDQAAVIEYLDTYKHRTQRDALRALPL